MRAFADFQKYVAPNETPLIKSLPKGRGWVVPDYCAKTKKQEVEPFMSFYTEAVEILRLVSPEQDDDEDWGSWEPSEGHVRLSKLAHRIGQMAYQEIDNPAYDENACLAWKEENASSWTKIEWGTGDMVDVSQTP